MLAVPPSAAAGSPFEWRGAIQGHYGRPFDHDERTRLIRFIAAHGFNAYVNAPKDDPYQRQAWRTRYPPALLAEFAAEIRLGRALGVRWIPAISPDRPRHPGPLPSGVRSSGQICFSCPRDRQALLDKLEPFWAAGARTFLIGFDDFEKRLTHSQDRAAFGQGAGAYGKANAHLLNRLLADMRRRDGSARLLTVPADYQGTQDSPYLRGFRSRLGPGPAVMWTGPQTRARDFSPAQAGSFARLIGRQPLVWDNWVNNDGSAMDRAGLPTRIFLGPYRRRPDIAGDVGGFFLNTATEPDLNLLPFATAGDWMTAPWTHNAWRSFVRHVNELGGSVPGALRAFAETSYASDLIPGVEAPTFSGRRDSFLAAYAAGGRWRHRRWPLEAELRRVRDAEDRLAAEPSLDPFVAQAGPFLAAARKHALAGLTATRLLARERPAVEVTETGSHAFVGRVSPPSPGAAADLRAGLASRERAMSKDPHTAYGGATGRYLLAPNAMDVFLGRVHGLDSGWRSSATAAGRSVSLRLGQTSVPVGGDGSFHLPADACDRLLTAIDGAGGRTAIALPRCSG